jgi:hypothetical protein
MSSPEIVTRCQALLDVLKAGLFDVPKQYRGVKK